MARSFFVRSGYFWIILGCLYWEERIKRQKELGLSTSHSADGIDSELRLFARVEMREGKSNRAGYFERIVHQRGTMCSRANGNAILLKK